VEDELVLIGGKSRNGLYEVKIKPDKESLLTEEGAEDWHRKLRHPSKDHTVKIKHLCEGVPSDLCLEDKLCGLCMRAKQTRKLFSSVRQRATRPLELIHTDLSGQLDPPIFDGYNY
jgi:hypothetical protein